MLRGISRVSARSCDRIMFVSEDSARWIGDLLDVPVARRAVVHHGIDASAWARPADEAPPAGYQPSYILSVSSIYPHKNYVRLIEAYAQLGRRHDDMPDLVIIGDVQHPDYLEEMERARTAAGEELAQRIHILGEVPYAEIKTYYAGADLFVFPSYLETFGIRCSRRWRAARRRSRPTSAASARSRATRRSTPIRTRPRRSRPRSSRRCSLRARARC
jgi:glycosyltransferase involved in cell wall biosynthesis